MNKKAEFPLITFIVSVILLLILAPVILKVTTSTTTGFFDAMESVNPTATAEGEAPVDTVLNFMDLLVVLGIGVTTLILFLSAFFIDTNPFFILLYIIFSFLLFLLIPELKIVLTEVWGQYSSETALYLPISEFIVNNLEIFMIGIYFLTGVIMYAKFKYFGQNGGYI